MLIENGTFPSALVKWCNSHRQRSKVLYVSSSKQEPNEVDFRGWLNGVEAKLTHLDVAQSYPGITAVIESIGGQCSLHRLFPTISDVFAELSVSQDDLHWDDFDLVIFDIDWPYVFEVALLGFIKSRIRTTSLVAGPIVNNRLTGGIAESVMTSLSLCSLTRSATIWCYERRLERIGFYAVPPRDENTDYVVFIPYVNGLDFAKRAVASIRSHHSSLVLIDQSIEGLPDLWNGEVAIFRWCGARHFVKMQNVLQTISAARKARFMLFMHSDAECDGDVISELLVRANAVESRSKYWGVIFTSYDALCLFKVEALQMVGVWDERFDWYYSDVDFYNRVHWAGLSHEHLVNAKVKHHGSQTIANLPPFARLSVRRQHAFAYMLYERKWGGRSGNEMNLVPFFRG